MSWGGDIAEQAPGMGEGRAIANDAPSQGEFNSVLTASMACQ